MHTSNLMRTNYRQHAQICIISIISCLFPVHVVDGFTYTFSLRQNLSSSSSVFTSTSFRNDKYCNVLNIVSSTDNIVEQQDAIYFVEGETEEGVDVDLAVFDNDYDEQEKSIERLDFEEAINFIQGDDIIAELDIVETLGREKHSEAALQCETALKRLLEFHSAGYYDELFEGLDEQSPFGIAIDAFNACLFAWSKSNSPHCGERAEAILELMANLKSTGLEPDIISFTNVLSAWAKSSDREHVFHADRILHQMYELYRDGVSNVAPDAICNTVVIQGWTRLSKNGDKGAAKRAHAILEKAEKACVEGKNSKKPDQYVYHNVLNAWALSNIEESGEMADNILQRMESLYQNGDENMKPIRKNYANIIHAYLKKCNDFDKAINRANALLSIIEEEYRNGDENMKPTDDIYRAFVFAWAKSDHESGPQQANEYLNCMLEKFAEGDTYMLPKTRTCNAVLEALSRSKDSSSMKQMLDLLRKMEEYYKIGFVDTKPIERSYTNFIRALSRSKISRQAKKASAIIDRMNSMVSNGNSHARPTTFTYNALLAACINDGGTEYADEAFAIAIKAFNDIQNERGGADSVTYVNLLNVLKELLPEGERRSKIAKATFHKCCMDGLVKKYTVFAFQQAVTPEIFTQITRAVSPDELIIPNQWKRNAKR